MAGVRAIQKEKTRRALIDAAFNQLSAEKSFSSFKVTWFSSKQLELTTHLLLKTK